MQKTETEPWVEPPDEMLATVAAILSDKQTEWTGRPTELAKMIDLDIAPNTLTKHLNIKCGRALDVYHIAFENRLRHAGRRIRLRIQLPQ